MKARKLMLDGVGLKSGQIKKDAILKRMVNKPFDLTCQGWNKFLDFVKWHRHKEQEEKDLYEKESKEKERVLKRIMNKGLRDCGQAFKQALDWTLADQKKERNLMGKQRGIMKKMLDQNTRLMGMGFNKLIEEWKAQQAMLKTKMQFLLKTMASQDLTSILQAYNGLKRRKMMLDGVGLTDQEAKKTQLIKRLTNKPFDLQCQGWNKFIDFCKWDRQRELQQREQDERDRREKTRILKRIMDTNSRLMGAAFRGAFEWTMSDRKSECDLMFRQRGIMRKILDQNARLMGMGFNKLVDEWKAKQVMLRNKLRFVLKTLADQDGASLMMAYNGMKARKLVFDGVGLANGQAKKIQLLKRLTNKPFDLQCQAFNQFLNFLKLDRIREDDQKRQDALDRQTKERYLNRIMDSNGRIMGLAFRQALQWSVDEMEKEQVLMGKQRGIMRKMLDQSTRLLGMGFNKLVEEWKSQQGALKNKMRFLLKTLTNQDLSKIL
jgi:hypothetical protein